MSPSTNNWR